MSDGTLHDVVPFLKLCLSWCPYLCDNTLHGLNTCVSITVLQSNVGCSTSSLGSL